MKKTLTKAASLVLVFAMLLSVFAVFAGSSEAKINSGLLEAAKTRVENRVNQVLGVVGNVADVITNDIMARNAALGQPAKQLGIAGWDIARIPFNIANALQSGANEIVAAATSPVTMGNDVAQDRLLKQAYTYTDPEGDVHALYTVNPNGSFARSFANMRLVNSTFGITALLDFALVDLEWCNTAAVEARYLSYSTQLAKLVALRDSKMNLLLDVYATGGDVVDAANSAVAAVKNVFFNTPLAVVSADANAKVLFAQVVRNIVLRPFPGTFLRFVETACQAVKTAVAFDGATLKVQSAVHDFMTFAQTIGGISDAVAATTGTVQALFNWMTEHISAALVK